MSQNNKNRRHHHNAPAVEVKGDKEILARPIESLGLPEETLTLLKNNKFNTVFDIARRTERDMFRVQTFNKRHFAAVQKAINAIGVDFLPFVKEKPEGDVNAQAAKPQAGREQPRQGAKPEKQNKGDARQPQDNRNARQGNGQPDNRNRQNNGKQDGRNQGNNKQPQPKPAPPERKPRVELPLEEWEKVQRKGKWGFSNGLNIVIQPQFDEVFSFKDGLACVDVGEKFGYIDDKGEFVITPQYDCAMSFSEGLAVFFEGEKCGYINKQNEVVIAAKYDAATPFENGRAKVKEAGKWQTIDAEGNTLWSK